MFLAQHKTYNKPNLPPLSSLLKDQPYKLPSIDTFYTHTNVSTDSLISPTGASTPATPMTSAPTPVPFAKKASPKPIETPAKEQEKKHKRTEKSFAFISHSVQTFPSQEPSIDNAPLARRKRRRTSANELNILNQEFLLGSTPNKLRRIEIANRVSMTEKAVQIWFQNKRQSIRKQSASEREITELPPTPEVTHDSPNNSSMNNSMNNSAVQDNSGINSMDTTANTSIISSTPIKPILNKSQSFSSPETNFKIISPIKQRSVSSSFIPTFSKPSIQVPLFNPQTSTPMPKPIQTPSFQVHHQIPLSNSTPDSSFVDESSENLVLNETRKKQPLSLNTQNSSTMTFKLYKFKTFNENKENMPMKKNGNKIQSLLNNAADENRNPLREISTNTNKKVNEGVKNLLSLREGNWK